MDKDNFIDEKSKINIEIKKSKKNYTNGWINNNVIPKMNSFANQRHLLALRNAVVSTMPLIIVGALFLLILNFPIGADSVLQSIMNDTWRIAFTRIFQLTMGLMGMVTAFSIGSELAKSYKMDPTTSGVLTLIGFMLWVGVEQFFIENNNPDSAAINAIRLGNLGSNGMFVAIITGILFFEFYRMCRKYNITIRMPRQVPAAIANSFIVIIPLFFYAVVVLLLRYVVGFDFINDLTRILSPLQGALSDTLWGTMVIVFFITFFWIFGLSGAAIVGSIMRPFWQIAIDANMHAWGEGAEIPYRYPEQFAQWGVWVGGAGATLGLLISALLFAKSRQIKSISKVSIIPGIFNINEPVIFGMPILLNLFLIIPFIFIPQIIVLTNVLWVQIFSIEWVAQAPWTLPGPLGGYLATGMNPMGWLPATSAIIISTVGYTPFLIAYDKQLLKEERLMVVDGVYKPQQSFVEYLTYSIFKRSKIDKETLIQQKQAKKLEAQVYKENKLILKESAQKEKLETKTKRKTIKQNLHNLIENYKSEIDILTKNFKVQQQDIKIKIKQSQDLNQTYKLKIEALKETEKFWANKEKLQNEFFIKQSEVKQ